MGRSPCCEKAHTNKGAWTKEEDQRLISYIKAHGEGCWRSLPKAAGLLRCGKSCRLRWINYLRPDLKRGNFTEEEDELIIKLHSLLGNKWSLIAGRLPGRTDNEIKNYWNTHIKRKLLNRGLDPQTHRPINGGGESQPLLSNAVENVTPMHGVKAMIKADDNNGGKNQRCPDLNLDLSISLPSFSSWHCSASSTSSSAASTSTTSSSPPAMVNPNQTVCVCCSFGSGGGEGRICSNCQGFRYFIPLQER
ncbi:hypothetical protein QJS10_CPA02g00569 [Acorus calamus]|uniref:Uncharacterized protein n=1 Tax=Acorus calamus TaxID=4465 RepID=A0AAV9FDU0_ACOCL|nr:hypothetical protein QJS10_CPA02g00569 [Acorus calamus]